MRAFPENAAESIVSTDIEARSLAWGGARLGQRTEGRCLSEGPVWSMFVVERFELSQRVE